MGAGFVPHFIFDFFKISHTVAPSYTSNSCRPYVMGSSTTMLRMLRQHDNTNPTDPYSLTEPLITSLPNFTSKPTTSYSNGPILTSLITTYQDYSGNSLYPLVFKESLYQYSPLPKHKNLQKVCFRYQKVTQNKREVKHKTLLPRKVY